MLKRENNPTSSSCLHFTGMNARFIGTENREMIRPTSLNVSFNEVFFFFFVQLLLIQISFGKKI